MENIKIVIPQNQKPVKTLMEKSGWTPIFEERASNRGVIVENGISTVQLRSMDALKSVAAGKADIGFVGSDCIEDKPNWRVESLGAFSFGRALNSRLPRLEIVASTTPSSVSSLDDVPAGTIFLSERPYLTYQYLAGKGFQVKIEGDENPNDFRNELIANGQVGIWIIQGSSPVQLEPGNDLGVMVNETGGTVDDYDLRVIAKIMDIQTMLIANPNSLMDETKREQILRFQKDLEGAYKNLEKETSAPSLEEAYPPNARSRL